MKNKTYVTQTQPWGLYTSSGHRVLCSDGVIRACRLASTPDTFFSIPASIVLNRKRISGYVTTREYRGEIVYCFRQLSHHNDKLPVWPVDWCEEFGKLMSKVFGE
jgi:hypothetical protein